MGDCSRMTMQRYFRSGENLYESLRLQLDAVWGHGPGTGTLTCYEPAATAPHDSEGRVLLAVLPEFCEYEAVSAILPDLIASGAVQEIAEAEYWAAMPQPELP